MYTPLLFYRAWDGCHREVYFLLTTAYNIGLID
ncbi:hypothetical protein F991_01999 [Acinetobacter sp. CIP-A165]|nr:hypothetical protein F991_01999 [Acinetobacter sp. CIP-A165]